MAEPRYKKLAEVLTGYSTVLKKGDTVLFGKYAGSDVIVDGIDYKILRESEILAKVN